jgi:hypothetical protein
MGEPELWQAQPGGIKESAGESVNSGTVGVVALDNSNSSSVKGPRQMDESCESAASQAVCSEKDRIMEERIAELQDENR